MVEYARLWVIDMCKSDEKKKIFCLVATNKSGHSTSQLLPFDESKFERKICLENILNRPDNLGFGYFLELDLSYP